MLLMSAITEIDVTSWGCRDAARLAEAAVAAPGHAWRFEIFTGRTGVREVREGEREHFWVRMLRIRRALNTKRALRARCALCAARQARERFGQWRIACFEHRGPTTPQQLLQARLQLGSPTRPTTSSRLAGHAARRRRGEPTNSRLADPPLLPSSCESRARAREVREGEREHFLVRMLRIRRALRAEIG